MQNKRHAVAWGLNRVINNEKKIFFCVKRVGDGKRQATVSFLKQSLVVYLLNKCSVYLLMLLFLAGMCLMVAFAFKFVAVCGNVPFTI